MADYEPDPEVATSSRYPLGLILAGLQVLGTRIPVIKDPPNKKKLKKKKLIYCAENEDDENCMVPTEGDNTGGISGYVSTILFSLLANYNLYPLTDPWADWDHVEEKAPKILEAASKEELKMLELYKWEQGMQDDEQLSRFAFAGIAAHRMEQVETIQPNTYMPDSVWQVNDEEDIAFKNDWTWMSQFEVRPGFERYGVACYFDRNATLKRMYWSEKSKMVCNSCLSRRVYRGWHVSGLPQWIFP